MVIKKNEIIYILFIPLISEFVKNCLQGERQAEIIKYESKRKITNGKQNVQEKSTQPQLKEACLCKELF